MLHSAIPLWREARIPFERAALSRDPVLRGQGVPRGDGEPVLLIPGFLAGDDSLAVMTHWLRRTGHRTRRAGIRSNVGCSQVVAERLAERVETVAEATGRRVALIGQSRGGSLAKVIAVRHPELVSGIITLGSPQLDPLDVHPFVRVQVYAVGTLGTVGIPGFFRHGCRNGACCERFWEDLRAPLKDDVGYMSIYSRSDGVVRWRSCLDGGAEHREVHTSHVGMAVSTEVYGAIAAKLAELRARELRPSRVRALRNAA
jgi:pimeloyl-ACP methyl ester carboxylesterase